MCRFLSYALVVSCGLLFAGTVAHSTPEVGTAAAMAVAPAQDVTRVAYREITIPAGTLLRLRTTRAFGSDISRVEQPVTASLARGIHLGGREVLPEGSTVFGYVTQATRSGKVKGRARVGVRFNEVRPAGLDERFPMRTSSWVAVAPATKKKDAVKIGVPAAGGAVVGALIGGKKGAGIGALAGGGAGTAVVLTTRGKEVRVGRGAILNVRLTSPLTVREPL
jgi:hypothetical protein